MARGLDSLASRQRAACSWALAASALLGAACSGSVSARGSASPAQVGAPKPGASASAVATAAPLTSGGAGACDGGPCAEVMQLSAGGHTCARMGDGSVRCWGPNTSGQLGGGARSRFRDTPAPVAGLAGATHVAVGGAHTCALAGDGAVRCWGSNEVRQLGVAGDGSAPTQVPGLVAKALSAGYGGTCALLPDTSVQCWGYNTAGQLGDGTTAARLEPRPVTGVSGAMEVVLSDAHACARIADGTVRCWGWNRHGQLGDGTTVDRPLPTPVSGVDGAVEIAVGLSHACARAREGAVWCWGNPTAPRSLSTPPPERVRF